MERRLDKQTSRQRLQATRPKAVSFAAGELIKTGLLDPRRQLPLVIEPAAPDLAPADWARNNLGFIEENLLKHGALLFRDFNLTSPLEFESFAAAMCPELFGEYGDLPREGVSGKIYHSTPYPADQTILFHNESSHLHRWPRKIWFSCLKAASQGGETPIVDCREVYRSLDSALKERFREKGLMYVRNYTSELDVSWESFFHTNNRAEVEAYCRKAGIDFEWKNSNGLRTRRVCPAVINHPRAKEDAFFNQIQLHHLYCLAPAVRESMLTLFREQDLPRHVYYGDGSPIEDSVVEEICEIYWRTAVRFPWREGDVLMLDNMLVAHARLPFTGARKIVVAMGEMIDSGAI